MEQNIVDILESETGNKLREEYKQKALTDRIPEHLEVYNYVLQDSFIRYIFSVLIPQYYDKQAEDYLNYFVQMLSESEKNYFNTLIKYTEEKLKKDLSIYEKIKLLCENTGNPIIKNNVSLIKNLEETSGKYRTYFETTPKNFLQVILQWIEKFNVEPVNIDEQFKMEETIEEIIKSKAVTSEEIQKNIKGKSDVDKPTLDKNFLKEHGILKDSDEANGISRKYFDNQSFTSLVRKREIFSIDGKDYRLKSYIDNTSQHNSYYLFEIVEDKLQDQENEQPSC